jgi:arylsulfatase A-like enzyme
MRNYYALITQVDKACGEIWEEVVAQQLENQTMIIFTTDNGMFHGAHGLAGKWYPYQESIRVPLIVYDPRMPKEKRGTVDDSFTLNIDLAETILSAAGVESPAIMQGRDISDLYIRNDGNENRSLDENPWREEFFYEFPYHDISFIPPSTALIQKKWKYIRWPKHGYEQLFNLEDDPLELHDLYGEPETADILKELRKRHDDQKHEVVRPNATNKEECVGQSTKDLLTRRV